MCLTFHKHLLGLFSARCEPWQAGGPFPSVTIRLLNKSIVSWETCHQSCHVLLLSSLSLSLMYDLSALLEWYLNPISCN